MPTPTEDKPLHKNEGLKVESNFLRGTILEGLADESTGAISDADTQLWNKYSSNTYEQLSRLDNTVQDAGLFSGQMIIIEVKNEDGTWPRQTRR